MRNIHLIITKLRELLLQNSDIQAKVGTQVRVVDARSDASKKQLPCLLIALEEPNFLRPNIPELYNVRFILESYHATSIDECYELIGICSGLLTNNKMSLGGVNIVFRLRGVVLPSFRKSEEAYISKITYSVYCVEEK